MFSEEEIDCPSSADYVYAPFEFEETLVTKWNLVCGESAKVAMVVTMYMFGLMIGSLLCGRMSDKFGRKKTLMFSILCSSVASLLGSFMPEYYSYTVTRYVTIFLATQYHYSNRVVTAIGSQGLFLCCFSLAVEVLGSKETVPFLPWVTYQTFFGVMIQAPFAVGDFDALLEFVP